MGCLINITAIQFSFEEDIIFVENKLGCCFTEVSECKNGDVQLVNDKLSFNKESK